MTTYKIVINPTTNENIGVIKNNEWFVPFSDPANTDYQAYLKWVSEGNTPLPAEE
jgi:hypothetical protein